MIVITSRKVCVWHKKMFGYKKKAGMVELKIKCHYYEDFFFIFLLRARQY